MNKLHNFWINTFWKHPNRLTALKVTISIAIGLIPAVLFNQEIPGSIFALGVVATSIAETQVHPRSRLKTILFTILCFALTASTVDLLAPYPIIFGILLILNTFLLLIIGGINDHYQKVTFGILLMTVYTMLGSHAAHTWYFQSTYFICGSLVYAAISLPLLYLKPWRIIKEQMSVGYKQLSQYAILKATLFPSTEEKQESVRVQLSQINITLSKQISKIKYELDCFYTEDARKTKPTTVDYYQKWRTLQELHTRLASSHERYDLLSKKTDNPELIAGFGQLMREVGYALHQYSEDLLTGNIYAQPISLIWNLDALTQLLEKHNDENKYLTLSLLLKNLTKIVDILKNLEKPDVTSDEKKFYKQPKNVSLKALFNIENPRFRFAVRLTLIYIVAYILMLFFNLEKGAWILMTALLITQKSYSDTRQRIGQRVFGTLVGVVVGLSLNSLLPTKPGQIVLLLGSVYLFKTWADINYKLAVIFITTFVLAVYNIITNTGIEVMAPRIVDTLIAAVLVFLVARFIWPDWQYKRLPSLLKSAISVNISYFLNVTTVATDETDLIDIKRDAHDADNELSSAWKGMLNEPKAKRSFISNAYNINSLNHSLLSYIAAFDTQQFGHDLDELEKKYCNEIHSLLSDTLMLLDEKNTTDIIDKFDYYKHWESDFFELKKHSQNPKFILLHNIARVSLGLLLESYKLMQGQIQQG